MTPHYEENGGFRIYHGDCRKVVAELPGDYVQVCVTSPPYFGLRDYGVDGQIGLEETPEQYVATMVELFREVRRVLKPDGTLWLNLGDSYNAYNGGRGPAAGINKNYHDELPSLPQGYGLTVKNLKPKDLIGIPWRVAFALQADGWYLRGDHVWAKPNGMPESIQDRPTRSHEYVFVLSKSDRYYYDSDAVRTAPKASSITRLKQDVESQIGSIRANGGAKTNGTMKAVRRTDKQGHTRRHAGFNDRWDAMEKSEQMIDGANLRSVWWVAPAQCSEAHFAVMPEMVAKICILAGSRVGDVVLDPFNGYCTTGYMARELGRRYMGIELNEEYIELSKGRLAQGVLFGASA